MTLDRERFFDIWSRCGSGEGKDRIFDELEAHYLEPHRHYHTTGHIMFCLDELDKVSADIKQTGAVLQQDAVELSIWFHDVVLEIPGANNEQKSAQLFLEVSDGRLDNDLRNRVHDAIIATTHKTSPDVLESQLTVDIDLSGLAQSWPEFFVDSRLVRAEFSHLSDKEFNVGQGKFMKSLLDRASIYSTEYFLGTHEATARKNVAQLIDKLETGYIWPQSLSEAGP